MTSITVLIADDQPVVLAGLGSILHGAPRIKVVGQARDSDGVVRQALRLRPNVLILDIALLGSVGLGALDEIRQRLPPVRVIMFAQDCRLDRIQRAFAWGAAAYVSKQQDPADLIEIIRTVHEGRTYLSPTLVEATVSELRRPPAKPRSAGTLTPREARVLELLVQDRSSKEIGAVLGISPRTVGAHRANIMRKLNVHSVSGLIRFALEAARQ